jgi:hypothetical protein
LFDGVASARPARTPHCHGGGTSLSATLSREVDPASVNPGEHVDVTLSIRAPQPGKSGLKLRVDGLVKAGARADLKAA